jgi:hypothetical protein
MSSKEVPFDGHAGLGIEALRRENEKYLEAEVAKWNALTPHEKPFEWRGKSAAEILEWRNARERQLLGLRKGGIGRGGGETTAEPCSARSGALVGAASARAGAEENDAATTHAPAAKSSRTTYEEKLARWKRVILEEKIIDLDDAAFEEKFAEWHTHALRLEAIKQEIARLEKKAVELKIEELKEQAAKQQAELEKAAKKATP